MWLKRIKLAGFKSFVGPVRLPFHPKCSVVVGPNGCGKSNVVDAIRWVIGENSTKMLRAGSSMSDVIFNGSSNRKPLGQASVELIFHNADGQLGGQYANFSEIAVKRSVDRDGQSIYYINGSRVRRKDIIDIFLGTGLGPRSYAVIEQGMVTRLIQAKPEELRSHLEEVAGISKYKEKRKETIRRLDSTRENLERVGDLQKEISEQSKKLQRQASVANRYREFMEKRRLLEAELGAAHWFQLNENIKQHSKQEEKINKELKQQLEQRDELNKSLQKNQNQIDSVYPQIEFLRKKDSDFAGEIARIEQKIEGLKKQNEQLVLQWQEYEKAKADLEIEKQSDKDARVALNQSIELLKDQSIGAKEKLEIATKKFQEHEYKVKELRKTYNLHRDSMLEEKQRSRIAETQISHIKDRIEETKKQITQLEGHDYIDQQAVIIEDLEKIRSELASKEAEFLDLQTSRDHLKGSLKQLHEQKEKLDQDIHDMNSEIHLMKGQKSSLQTLQEQALKPKNHGIEKWLQQSNLDKAERLGQKLDVNPKWQRAVEIVLAGAMQAICVKSVDDFANKYNEIPDGELYLVESFSKEESAPGTLLAEVKNSENWAASLLSQVLVADSKREALSMRDKLKGWQSVITPEGLWLGVNWLYTKKKLKAKQEDSFLARQEHLKELSKALKAKENELAKKLENKNDLLNKLCELESHVHDFDKNYHTSMNEVNRLKTNLEVKAEKLKYAKHQQQVIDKEADQAKIYLQTLTSKLKDAENSFQSFSTFESDKEKTDENMRVELSKAQNKLNQLREDASFCKVQHDDISRQLISQHDKLSFLDKANERSAQQAKRLEDKKEDLEKLSSETTGVEKWQAQLEERKVERQNGLVTLAEQSKTLQECEERRREYQAKLEQVLESIETYRDAHEEIKIAQQARITLRKQYEEKIAESAYNLDDLLSVEPCAEKIDPEKKEQELIAIKEKLSRFGAVNLAASEEYKEVKQRAEYLETQANDLTEALETLEKAIAKIDQETRHTFKETMDQVNETFKGLFPEIFGGGQAYLRLNDSDLLKAGVEIHAQPPGKKNASVHLLSGGEKALTAIALVFSLFQLNPAPFCVLDEVDAPLDDQNVKRFADLIKRMSETMQFIIITHNQHTMTIGETLTGVTMHEPGSSRVVAVDMQQALNYVEDEVTV